MKRRDHRGDDALRHRHRRAGESEQLRSTTVRDRVLHALGDLVLALEEAEAAAPRGQVLDVARDGVDEVVHLRDERWNERCSKRHDREDRADEHDCHREPAPRNAALQEPLDRRVERGCEEHGDEDPDQDPARCLHHRNHHDGREDDPEHDQDRAGGS